MSAKISKKDRALYRNAISPDRVLVSKAFVKAAIKIREFAEAMNNDEVLTFEGIVGLRKLFKAFDAAKKKGEGKGE